MSVHRTQSISRSPLSLIAICWWALGCASTVVPEDAGDAQSHDAAPDGPHSPRALHIAVGWVHTCAVLSDGSLRCWGANEIGQLGAGTTPPQLLPVGVPGIAGAQEVTAGANANTCVLLQDRSVRCWGSNQFGQVGNGTWIGLTDPPTGQSTPVAVTGLSNVVSLSTGIYAACAALEDGSARCWGWNASGQLGDGTIVDRHEPVQVSGLTNVVSISAGDLHACAVLADGTARCWGANLGGEIGDGSAMNERHEPVVVSGLSDAVAIAAGRVHTCALRRDGSVVCWGGNPYGDIGDGTTTNRLTPVLVPGIQAVSINSQDDTTCAVLVDHTVRCWGQNQRGQVGDGTTVDRLTPTQVQGLADIVDVATSVRHTCAVSRAGRVWCWGSNDPYGLGDGTTANHLSPVEVVLPQ